jgi:phage terminase small subunit
MLTIGDVFASLTSRDRRFVEEYAVDWNATAAYKRAGYRASGHAAEANACRLCKRLDVATAIAGLITPQRCLPQDPTG